MKQPISVLIVDDRDVVRLSLKDILLGFDCAFTEAGDGATALELLSENRFDVIFLDLRLPDLSGIEILREARRLGVMSGEVIVLTGQPEPATEQEARELGAISYLKKSPIDREEILAAFTKALPESLDPTATPSLAEEADRVQEETPELMNRPRILVVDDEPLWRNTMELILEARYELTLAPAPAQAMALVKTTFFSLAILDQRLTEGVSGIELLSELRKIQPDLRSIILTGYAELEDGVRSMQIPGVIDYLMKGRPNLADDLQLRVERALRRTSTEVEEEVAALIRKGESNTLELKASARWDVDMSRANKDLEWIIVRAVAAFLNSEIGGALLIGVDGDGKVVGLKQDYQTLRRKDRDGFETFLTTLFLGALDKDLSPLLRIDFPVIEDTEICRVSVKPSPKPAFARNKVGEDHFFIRTGNSTRQLTGRDVLDYCKRWK
jgi:CheY-like chemotaxis protein